MAVEAAVRFALGKLANIMMKEREFLGEVGKQVKLVQIELIRNLYSLRDAADSKHNEDARVHNWLNELCDVAYRIEDAIDKFFLELDYHKKPSFLQKVKKMSNKPSKMHILHKLGTELDKIQNKLIGISKIRVDYGFIEPQNIVGNDYRFIEWQSIVGEAVIMPVWRATYQEVDETEVVGRQIDKDIILNMLRPEHDTTRTVITIVGPGGVGKTTLARIIYKSARADFDCHIMLSISHTFNLTDLLRKMLLELKVSIPDNQSWEILITELYNFLWSRRYLIILDDMRTVDLWTELELVLPDVKNGSRVLMTSRFMDVAESVDSKMRPYELMFLDEEKSLNLLLQKALPHQEPNGECPSNLLELANKLSKKCKRLPLTLIVVGGVLSTKEQNCHEWEKVLRTMDGHSDDMEGVLAMSYKDMPYYLKACFQYLACFPEVYEISAKRLIRMWIVEGFIPHDKTKTLEETAENCLEELFRRSMVQVSSRSISGSIKYCKVHYLLRDLATHTAGQENFVRVFSRETDVNQPNRGIRRFSLQYSLKSNYWSERSTKYVGPDTRSILMFEFEYKSLPNFSNFRLLKVLVLENCRTNSDDLQVIGLYELVYLKYLALINCNNLHVECSFHCMKALEILEIRGDTELLDHDALWTIGTLRHVLGNCILYGPPSTIDLSNLQTMKTIWLPRTWDGKFPVLNNLRKLGLHNEFNDWVTVTNLLKVLPSLVSLDIAGYNKMPMEIVYPKALPNYQNLQSLSLYGEWPEAVDLEASSLPPHLVKLKLLRPRFKQNPMPELGKLLSLKKLSLLGLCFVYDSPTMCPAGFPVLQNLIVVDWRYENDFTVVEGVMPKLTYIKVKCKLRLHMPPELQHVTIDQY